MDDVLAGLTRTRQAKGSKGLGDRRGQQGQAAGWQQSNRESYGGAMEGESGRSAAHLSVEVGHATADVAHHCQHRGLWDGAAQQRRMGNHRTLTVMGPQAADCTPPLVGKRKSPLISAPAYAARHPRMHAAQSNRPRTMSCLGMAAGAPPRPERRDAARPLCRPAAVVVAVGVAVALASAVLPRSQLGGTAGCTLGGGCGCRTPVAAAAAAEHVAPRGALRKAPRTMADAREPPSPGIEDVREEGGQGEAQSMRRFGESAQGMCRTTCIITKCCAPCEGKRMEPSSHSSMTSHVSEAKAPGSAGGAHGEPTASCRAAAAASAAAVPVAARWAGVVAAPVVGAAPNRAAAAGAGGRLANHGGVSMWLWGVRRCGQVGGLRLRGLWRATGQRIGVWHTGGSV